MEKTNRKTLEEIIRVDHAGERGAIKIYEGQLLALKTIKQDETLKDKIVLIAARDKPKTLKLTFLQLMLFLFSCSRSCSLDRAPDRSPTLHTNDSLKKSCSIPK